MGILGAAIARHLTKCEGLYSVELPKELMHEMRELVTSANAQQVQTNRAILITDDPVPPVGIMTAPWRDALSWRNSDDRVFVWARGGTREPDTSFSNVVRPFISGRFPGARGGECTLEHLVRLCINELCERLTGVQTGGTHDAFLNTATWITEALKESYKAVGSEPRVHWSDRFLIHWSEMLEDLHRDLATLAQVEARHAWEIVRLSGLPLPGGIAGAYHQPPKTPEPKDLPAIRDLWDRVVRHHLIWPDTREALFSALEHGGTTGETPWRRLPWTALENVPRDTPAPNVGRKIFAAPSSPNFLLQAPTPPAPAGAWWAVTTHDLARALRDLGKKTPLLPIDCTGLRKVAAGKKSLYVLETRSSIPALAHTNKKWRARVVVDDVQLMYSDTSKTLHVGDLEPATASDGDTWITPALIKATMGGADVSVVSATKSPDEKLHLTLQISVEYTATIDRQSGIATGSWKPSQNLRIRFPVDRRGGNQWHRAQQEIDQAVEVVIPSPFAPTLIVADEKDCYAVEPNKQVSFSSTATGSWIPESTPEIRLDEEGKYDVLAYDGTIAPDSVRFAPPAVLKCYAETFSEGDAPHYSERHDCKLDEDDLISSTNPSADIAVVRVTKPSTNLSSGVLAAFRNLEVGLRQPSNEARDSMMGQYQVHVTSALAKLASTPATPINSLFQYVVSSKQDLVEWPPHPGTPEPVFLPERMDLPGILNGPSPALVALSEWGDFMAVMADVIQAFHLNSSEAPWLSGLDFSKLGGQLVRRYALGHRELVQAAKRARLHAADSFWAAYPFSVMIVEGHERASLGHLLAVMLSPLHPARLAWTYIVTKIARKASKRNSAGDAELMQLMEGWNIPCSGTALTATGQPQHLICVPIDPGHERDFISWSALVVLGNTGLADLPVNASGRALPWGGRNGINAKVIEHAIRDYLVAHPHANSLEVDVRAVSKSPRSQEVDDALLDLIAAESVEEVEQLGGGTRIWDSRDRLGAAPTRDSLLAVRGNSDRWRPFEWRTYDPNDDRVRISPDVALVENATVNMAIVGGDTHGVVGVAPLRRFMPSTLSDLQLDQNFGLARGEDVLGLSDLLAEIETPPDQQHPAIRAKPQQSALGIGSDARWEVLGSFNLDPALVSALVARNEGKRAKLLWEWRPSWMPLDREPSELARRPYYVVAHIPASLLKALGSRQALSQTRAAELLEVLGHRGIGLSALSAEGGTQESAAAGYFYGIQLLLPKDGLRDAKGPLFGDCIVGAIPIDPIVSILAGLAGRPLKKRSDMLFFAIVAKGDGSVHLRVFPVELKHHGMPGQAERLPSESHAELRRAREQLVDTKQLLTEAFESLAGTLDENGVASNCLKRLALATIVDLALSFAPNPPPPAARGKILAALLSGQIDLCVGNPVMLWFAPGAKHASDPYGFNGHPCRIDPYGPKEIQNVRLHEIFLDPGELPHLWWKDAPPDAASAAVRTQVNEAIKQTFDACGGPKSATAAEYREAMEKLLGFDEPTPGGSSSPPSPTPAGSSPAASTATPTAGAATPVAAYSGTNIPSTPRPSVVPVPPSPRAAPTPATEQATAPSPPAMPTHIIGWPAPDTRWATVGQLAYNGTAVALDLDHPKTVGIFGYMGSGKSYLLGNLIESAVEELKGINSLQRAPLAVVVFNYRRNAADRFELASLGSPNTNSDDIARLTSEYGTIPTGIRDLHVICLPGELRDERKLEYGSIPATELYFHPDVLGVEDWELLMGEPGSDAVFARTIRAALVDLRARGSITLEKLEQEVATRLSGTSKQAAMLRFEFVRRYISAERGTDFKKLLRAGRVLIVDLRQPLFNKDDALRFFLVCASQISKVQGEFNKMLVFDEAHEYMSDDFGDRMESRIRLMRHEGTSYVFATQDVASIPEGVSKFLENRFVFDLGTRDNSQGLEQVAPEFKGLGLLGMRPGTCLVQANKSTHGFFSKPREIRVRPRVTQHGGGTRIFRKPTKE